MVRQIYDRFGPIRIIVRLQANSISDCVWAMASQTQNDLSWVCVGRPTGEINNVNSGMFGVWGIILCFLILSGRREILRKRFIVKVNRNGFR